MRPSCVKCGGPMYGPCLSGRYSLKYTCSCGHVEARPTLDAPKPVDLKEIMRIEAGGADVS